MDRLRVEGINLTLREGERERERERENVMKLPFKLHLRKIMTINVHNFTMFKRKQD